MQMYPVESLDLFHQLPCPSMVTDMAGQILICNAAFLEILGATQEALNHTEMANLFGPVDRQLLLTSIWPRLMRRDSVSRVFNIVDAVTRIPTPRPVPSSIRHDRPVGLPKQTLLISRDGTESGIEDTAAPIRNAGGEIRGAELVFHDVTAQIHMREGGDHILGATIVGRNAGELINNISLAMVAGLGLRRLAGVIHAYPTQGEAVRQAAQACAQSLAAAVPATTKESK